MPFPAHVGAADLATREAAHAVEAAVPEAEGAAVDARGFVHTTATARQTADLEDVGEIGGQTQLEAHRQRLEREAMEHQAEEQLRPAEERRPANGERRARGEPAVLLHVVVGEVRDRPQVVRRHGGREEERRTAAGQQLELREMAGPAEEETHLLLERERDVAGLIQDGERVLMRQDVLAPATRER